MTILELLEQHPDLRMGYHGLKTSRLVHIRAIVDDVVVYRHWSYSRKRGGTAWTQCTFSTPCFAKAICILQDEEFIRMDTIPVIADAMSRYQKDELGTLARELASRYPNEALEGLTAAKDIRRAIPPQLIVHTVLRAWHGIPVTYQQIIGDDRSERVCFLRGIVADLLHDPELLGMPLMDVGAFLGQRNHSTIISALKRVDRTSPTYQTAHRLVQAMIHKGDDDESSTHGPDP